MPFSTSITISRISLNASFNDRILDRIVNTLNPEVFDIELVWICMKDGSRFDARSSVHPFGVFVISWSCPTNCNVWLCEWKITGLEFICVYNMFLKVLSAIRPKKIKRKKNSVLTISFRSLELLVLVVTLYLKFNTRASLSYHIW